MPAEAQSTHTTADEERMGSDGQMGRRAESSTNIQHHTNLPKGTACAYRALGSIRAEEGAEVLVALHSLRMLAIRFLAHLVEELVLG